VYINAEAVLEAVLARVKRTSEPVRLVVCDLSASPTIDLAGSRMLHELHAVLAMRGAALRVVGAHGTVRDLLRADGLEGKVAGLERTVTVDTVLGPYLAERGGSAQKPPLTDQPIYTQG
jgi:SulP family sulfate permease